MINPTKRFVRTSGTVLAAAILSTLAVPTLSAAQGPGATYADLADLSDSARLVLRAQVRKIVAVEPAVAWLSRNRRVKSGAGRT